MTKGLLKVDTTNLKKYLQNLEKARKALQKEFKAVLKLNTNRMLADIKKNTPVDTGLLRNSFEANVDENKLEAEIGTNVDYAPYVEYGHRVTPHWVPGVSKKDGRFEYQKGVKTGIYVGKETKFVKGHFMVTNAEKRAKTRLDRDVKKLLRRLEKALR